MLAHVKRNGLLGALLHALATTGAGLVDLVYLLQLTRNGLKLTGTLANGATDA